jgi:hypothetical protein
MPRSSMVFAVSLGLGLLSFGTSAGQGCNLTDSFDAGFTKSGC